MRGMEWKLEEEEVEGVLMKGGKIEIANRVTNCT